jgi:hypothetical protein
MTHDPNDWNPLLPAIDVPEHKPVNTGILDRYGKPIERQPRPIGFHVPQGKRRG